MEKVLPTYQRDTRKINFFEYTIVGSDPQTAIHIPIHNIFIRLFYISLKISSIKLLSRNETSTIEDSFHKKNKMVKKLYYHLTNFR